MSDSSHPQFHNPATWTLRDWVDACGNPSITDLVRYSLDCPIAESFEGWKNKTVYSWLDRGISNRLDALRMIYTLTQASRIRGHILFQGIHLPDHAALFLESAACTQPFKAATEAEIRTISGSTSTDDPYAHHHAIRYVNPPPPVNLPGREMDVLRTLNEVNQSFLTVIAGPPGIGKTALAWHVSQEALHNGLIQKVAWLDAEQYSGSFSDTRDSMTEARRSIAVQLGWSDLLVAPEADLPAMMNERLRNEPVLMVFDSIATPERQQYVANRHLNGISQTLNPHGRVLITVDEILDPDLARANTVTIGAISSAPMKKVWRIIEETLHCVPCDCNAQDWNKIIDIAGGNPLIMRMLMPILVNNSISLSAVHSKAMKINPTQRLDLLFGYAYASLNEPQQWLARAAAFKTIHYSREELADLWIRGNQQGWAEFSESIEALTRNNFLVSVQHDSGPYSMTNTARQFLMRTGAFTNKR
jgi:hypothetical protein